MRPGEPLILWDWTFNHLPDIARRVQEHLILTGIAISIGFVVAFVLSLLIRQFPFFYAPVPAHHVATLRQIAKAVTYGWGMVPVEARIGDVAFKTSLSPRTRPIFCL